MLNMSNLELLDLLTLKLQKHVIINHVFIIEKYETLTQDRLLTFAYFQLNRALDLKNSSFFI